MDYEAVIDRQVLHRVLDMPGLTAIGLQPKTAVLTFTTSSGCEPAGLDFISSEVDRMSGGAVISVREV